MKLQSRKEVLTMTDERNSRSNHRVTAIGFVFVILCVIGIITVFQWCYRLTGNLADNTAQKTRFEKMLLPVVMFDPADFTDPATCDNEFLLQSSLWACMLGEYRGTYEYDEYDRLIIPVSDVDAEAAALFGSGITLEHKTVGDLDNAYLYDEEIASYHVPIIAMTGFATPKVEKIAAVGENIYHLTVGYVPPTTLLSIDYDSEGNMEEAPSKYMLYELHKNGNSYTIYAISSIASDIVMGDNSGDYLPGLDSLEGNGGEENPMIDSPLNNLAQKETA